MSLIDDLRAARCQSISVLHEFLSQYDPRTEEIHTFVEGFEDRIFFGHFITKHDSKSRRSRFYLCRGKRGVLEVSDRIATDHPGAKVLLFCVDTDLADFLGAARPDPKRVFSTERYSIENYLACPKSLRRLVEETFVFSGVAFDLSIVDDVFEKQMRQFTRRALPLMGWILAHRRLGSKPNLNDIDIKRLLSFADGALVGLRPKGGRIAYLDRVCGVATPPDFRKHLTKAMSDLSRSQPHLWIRGKFVRWFIVEFLRGLESNFGVLATEAGGSFKRRVVIDNSNLIESMAGRISEPRELTTYLASQLS